MGNITPVSWQTFEKFLSKQHCEFRRQTGSHRVYSRKGLERPIVVPKRKELPIFVIKNNLRVLGISVEEYLEQLEKL